MPVHFVTAGVTAPDPTPFPDSDLDETAFDRVRQTARSIADRVRRALAPAGAVFTSLRVLVVDDHPDAADALTAVLEMLGCPARACHDGPSALAVAAEFRPHVCLLDLVMPRMDGIELAARLRDQAGARPLLLVATTALGDVEAQVLTAIAGFHYHLTKPVDAPTLIEVLTRLGKILGCSPAPAPDGLSESH